MHTKDTVLVCDDSYLSMSADIKSKLAKVENRLYNSPSTKAVVTVFHTQGDEISELSTTHIEPVK